MVFEHAVWWRGKTKLEFKTIGKVHTFWEISNIDLSYVVMVNYTVEILETFVALSEYMNFNITCHYEFKQLKL